MRISRRTSGGRGEYEISEASAFGLTAKKLRDKKLIVDFGNHWKVDTGVTLTGQGGKPRLRITDDRADMQVHLQVAAALLMPHSVRTNKALGRGVPVLRASAYAIDHIRLSAARTVGDSVVLRPSAIEFANISHHAEVLSVRDRISEVRFLWTHADKFPEPIRSLLRSHQQQAESGEPIREATERVVVHLQREVTLASHDLGIGYRAEAEDVVPHLLGALRWSEEPAEPPISVDEISPDEVEIKRRTVKDWKRWANARGVSSARFMQAVRRAYNSTCVACGLHLPATESTGAGVDAAHILPWSDYELDEVSNGVCLCKHHHWAFDEGLLVIVCEQGKYRIEIPAGVVEAIRRTDPNYSLDDLLQHGGPIPETRLPASKKERPKQQFLEELRANS